jgi:putative phage-type endonuclease
MNEPIRNEFLYNICEFLSAVENDTPVPGHETLLDDWELDVREYFISTFHPSEDEQLIFDTVLSARREAYQLVKKTSGKPVSFQEQKEETNSWQWLLDATQVEQRTQEWYREKENLLTASEIASLWAGPLTRARLVMSKVPKEEEETFNRRLAIPRAEGNAMDWGVRYEPVVKMLLEKQLGLQIKDLGRIRHQTHTRLAASPDGLIVSGAEELVGRLVEIKCPPTRPILEGKIPFEYWCQMQIQMEVCERPACEYVEVKFKEVDAADSEAEGWITLERCDTSNEMRYVYHDSPLAASPKEGWSSVETYGWKVLQMLRVTVPRDTNWFASIQNDLEAFWNDVEAARAGTWVPPPPRVKKPKKELAFLPEEPETSEITSVN